MLVSSHYDNRKCVQPSHKLKFEVRIICTNAVHFLKHVTGLSQCVLAFLSKPSKKAKGAGAEYANLVTFCRPISKTKNDEESLDNLKVFLRTKIQHQIERLGKLG